MTVWARKWLRSGACATLELWQVKGLLHVWPRWSRGDDHCIWYRVYPHEEWELVRWMLTHTVAPVLPGEDSGLASEAPGQHPPTSLAVHEVFLDRAAKALEKCCMTSPLVDTGATSATTPAGNAPTQDQGEAPETEANSAELTVVSAAVVGAEVPEQFTSLPGAVDSPAEAAAIGPAMVEAERLEKSLSTVVGVERKACPGCGDALLWTDHSDGRYIGGWACDNHEVCGV